jgi:hypothetical protein
MALTIAEVLDKLIGREDTRTSINSMTKKASAVGLMLQAVGNPIRTVSSPVQAYTTLTDPTFLTWDNTSQKTSVALAGDIGEMVAVTAYSIVYYPKQYDVDINAFPEQFAVSMANGFAAYIDDRVLNAAGVGVIPLASGVSNATATTVSGATTFQLYSDLTRTMGLVNADGYRVNGIISELAEDANILSSVSTTGQPIFTTDSDGRVVRLLGRPYAQSYVNLANGARFVVGDWTKISAAMVDDLKFETFTSGTVNSVNLIEQNAIAVRAEARFMFKITQPAAFAYLYS